MVVVVVVVVAGASCVGFFSFGGHTNTQSHTHRDGMLWGLFSGKACNLFRDRESVTDDDDDDD